MKTKELLAKSTGETLFEHTWRVIQVSQFIVRNLPLPLEQRTNLEKRLTLCAAVHDVGKVAAGFQSVLLGEQRDWQGKRHEILSTAFAANIAEFNHQDLLAILTHHRCIPSDGIKGIHGSLPTEQLPWQESQPALWRQMLDEWNQNREVFAEFWRQVCGAIKRSDLAEFGKVANLQYLGISDEWLERSVKFGQVKRVSAESRREAALIRGLLITSDHLASAHRRSQKIPRLSKYAVLKQSPRHFQEKCAVHQGHLVLRAPTGSGKTAAALLWARNNQKENVRLFYVLPFTASINAMHRRLIDLFGLKHVGVLHSKATSYLYDLQLESETSNKIKAQARAVAKKSLAKEMYYPIRVCTPHQILRYVLRGKGWEQMLSEFPQACFIYDEIHAYDPRVVGLTLASARLFASWGANVLFASATLPKFLERQICSVLNIDQSSVLAPDPNFPTDLEILVKKRHIVEIRDGSIENRLSEIFESSQRVNSTLVVCNHVKTAQQVYQQCVDYWGKDGIVLLHSRFNAKDRNQKERKLAEKSLPRILIATQVVEVSLDVDFDQAFLEPAPIDALVQRMGRVNREGKKPPAKVTIFSEQVNPHPLYDKERVKASLTELAKAQNPLGENDLVSITDAVYGDGYTGDELVAFEEGLNHPDIVEFDNRLLAGAHQDWIDEVIEKAGGSIELLPKVLLKRYEQLMKNGLWLEASALLVSVRFVSLASLPDGVINKHHDPWIIDCLYDSELGLQFYYGYSDTN